MDALCHNSERRGVQRRNEVKMGKGLRKVTAGILTVLLIIGSLQLVPLMPVQAEGESGGTVVLTEQMQEVKRTYTFSQLAVAGGYNYEKTETEEGGLTLAYSQQYGEVRFAFPQEVDASYLKKIVVDAEGIGNLSLKFLDGDGKQLEVSYGSAELTVAEADPEKIQSFAVMNLVNGENTAVINKVTFVTEEPVQLEERTYTFSQLTVAGGYNYEKTETEEGGLTLAYSQQYGEIRFAFPKEVNVSYLKKILVDAEGIGNLSLKFLNGDGKEIEVSYNSAELAVAKADPEEIQSFAVMNLFEGKYTAVLNKVTFVTEKHDEPAEPEEPQSGEITYTADQLKFTKRYSGDPVEMPYTFNARFDEIWFQLPKAVNLDQCEGIILRTADQGGELCVKLYDGSGTSLEDKYGIVGKEEYLITPGVSGIVTAIAIMANDVNIASFSTDFVSITFKMTAAAPEEPPKDVPFDTNLIKNPDFADAEALDAWCAESNGAEVSAEVSSSPIYDDVTTYGKITGRTSNYQCFAQDVTEILEKGQEYQFTFWVMLDPEDYKDAPESQRTVEISPYITANGSTQYGSGVSGTTRQVVTPGEWVKFTGTYKPSWAGSLEKAVIRILEQGENYGAGDGVKGTYYVTGVDLRKLTPVKYEIEQDIPDLKDSITEALGADTIVGTAVTASEMTDDTLMQLVTKHFNAVTLGNELKLDAMLGYATTISNTETVEFNGQQFLVPVLDHSRADGMLDVILKWNQEHPDDVIRVRGHVLVWHSQAPKGFFRENYQADGELVSKEVMDLRLEWYIKTMLEYYTGENSKYKDLFYGWDVVNEAISDGTATYRSAAESDWAAIYGSQSSEYIIKAFRWANQYAPSGLELYYNDYNDSTPSKREGIVKLLQAVKEAEGTRIDGMGMQAHYDMSSPSITQFEEAARAYAAVVGKVQLTEMDFKASSAYDGTDATRGEEFNRQAYRYKAFYDAMKKLEAEGCNVSGITIWGVVDKYSWLQDSSSVGGGADGTRTQCPLLFDDYYKAKPSFWAFVDPTKLEPSIQKVTVTEDIGFGYDAAEKYVFGNETVEVEFLPTWEGNAVKIKVTVKDPTADENDSVTLYADPGNTRSDSLEPLKATVYRKDAESLADGYQAELSLEIPEASITKKIGMDIRVADGDTLLSFNDYTNVQDTGSKYYAEAVLKPYAQIVKGTAVVDGEKESIWMEKGVEIPLSINLGSKVSAKVTALWDENYLYIFAEVKDALLNADSVNAHERDSLEVFIDENNHKSETYEEDDKQYRISYQNEQTFNGTKCTAENVASAAKETDDGYVIEARFQWTDITPQEGMEIGFELQINDADETGSRTGTLSWYDETGMGWSSPGVFGRARLTVKDEPKPSPTPEPSPTPTPAPSAAPAPAGTPAPSATPAPAPTPAPSAAPAPTGTPAPSAEPEVEGTEESEVSVGIAMPDQIKETVEKLENLLLDEDASEKQKLNAVNKILESIQAEAEENGLAEYSPEAIEYTEEAISRALGKKLEIELVGSDMPEVSKVSGALLSAEAGKEIRLVLTKLLEGQEPEVSEEYGNGYAMDINLYADGENIQPLVPVTIRVEIPVSIDSDLPVKVLHYGEGSEEPEILDARVIGGEIEFTTKSFSSFVIVNVMEKIKDEGLLGDDPVISAGGEGIGIDPAAPDAAAPQSGGSNRVVMIVVIVILAVLLLLIGLLLVLKAKKNRA